MILIGIATYKRPQKLNRLLKSLAVQTVQNFDVCIVFDNNDDSMQEVFVPNELLDRTEFYVNVDQRFVIGCWNRIHNLYKGRYDTGHLMLCDDVELLPDCLERAQESLVIHSDPYTDAVIGLTQVYPGRQVRYEPAGQTLIGRKFLDRYELNNVCCPAYCHWNQDVELRLFSHGIGKFFVSPEAKLIHHHPLYERSEMDVTHTLSRGLVWKKDRQIFMKRQVHNLIWGQSWELGI